MSLENQGSIEQKIGFLFRAAVSFCLVTTALGFAAILFFYSYRSFNQELRSVAKVVAATSRAALAFNDKAAGERVLAGLAAAENIKYAALINLSGSVLAEYSSAPQSKHEVKLRNTEEYSWSLSSIELSLPVTLEGEVVGGLYVVSSLASFYYQLGLFLLLSVLLVILAAIGASYMNATLRNLVSEPIVSLQRMTQQIASTKDFSTRISLVSKSDDEVQQLIRSFNQMLEQIEDRDRALRLAKSRAEEADKMKSVFLATVSHELRTPIHAILGMTDEVLDTSLTDEQKELLGIVKTSGTMLISIINDILDFSKIEAGKLTLVLERVKLRVLLEQVFQMFDVTAKRKGIELKLFVAPNVPPRVIADGGRLIQILVNLIGNAIKFTPSGSIELRVSNRGTARKEGFHQLEFCIADTGIGIPEAALKTIFDSFTQVRRQGETTEGTGLGLSISSKLVELMGGWIWAESIVGEGSQFHFVVEVEGCHRPSDTRLYTVPSQASRLGTEKVTAIEKPPESTKAIILVVEDNKVNSTLAARVLNKAGYGVLIAFNGQECLEILASRHVDLILMDLNMPVMDGLTATRKIRELELESKTRIPIVALTANAVDDQSSICFTAGMDGYLTKPLARELLLNTLSEFLAEIPSSESDQKKPL